jgi:serine/threonine protein phosphatase PrpC
VNVKLHAVGITDIGNVRVENQDSFTVQTAPCTENGNSLLAVVADGVGGGKAGNVASKIAVEALTDIYLKNTGNPQDVMRMAIETANALIQERSREDELCSGMATTCTALMVKGDTVIIGHVGDSRAYRIRDGEIVHLTQDHTLPRKLFREGLITEEEIEFHPQGNVLTNAVGSRKMIEVDIISYEMIEQDTFVLCSDGLYKYFKDEEIKEIVSKAGIEASPERFVTVAKERGGDDNITVVVVHAGGDRLDKTTEILEHYQASPPCKKKKVGWKTMLALIFCLGVIDFVVEQWR